MRVLFLFMPMLLIILNANGVAVRYRVFLDQIRYEANSVDPARVVNITMRDVEVPDDPFVFHDQLNTTRLVETFRTKYNNGYPFGKDIDYTIQIVNKNNSSSYQQDKFYIERVDSNYQLHVTEDLYINSNASFKREYCVNINDDSSVMNHIVISISHPAGYDDLFGVNFNINGQSFFHSGHSCATALN